MWATTKVRTFRGDIAIDDFYRKAFTRNDLPNVYMVIYFTVELASELFAMIEIIFSIGKECTSSTYNCRQGLGLVVMLLLLWR